MERTMMEILEHHNTAVLSDNYEEMIADYAEDAVLITLSEVHIGQEAIGGALRQLIRSMPNMKPIESSTNYLRVEGDTLLLRWSAESDTGRIRDAVDTIVIRDGKIWRQTTTFDVAPR